MSMVRFATVCDICHSRSEEYLAHTISCKHCQRDVCEQCSIVYDPDPPGYAFCRECGAKLKTEYDRHQELQSLYGEDVEPDRYEPLIQREP